MAVARFQILLGNGEMAPTVSWRFLSANNRRLCRSAGVFADVDTCWAAIRELCGQLGALEGVTSRNGPRTWVWRVRLARAEIAVSTRTYERWLEADRACAVFLVQVAHVPEGRRPQVVQY